MADVELTDALHRVRAATGSKEADATLVRPLAVGGAEAELAAGLQRREAAVTLFALMDEGRFALDSAALDRLNGVKSADG